MESRAKAFGHPIHPMLIVFPLGLLATGVIFDIVYLSTDDPTFAVVSFWMLVAGVTGGLLAAFFGLLDWLAIPRGTRAKSVGLWHGIGNVIVTAFFVISVLLRQGSPDHMPSGTALALSFVGAALALVTGWLGGELVYRLGVGVDRGAGLDASFSMGDDDGTLRDAGAGRRAMPPR